VPEAARSCDRNTVIIYILRADEEGTKGNDKFKVSLLLFYYILLLILMQLAYGEES
jgi:hypothetical protein